VAGWPNIERAEDRWLAESLDSDRAAPARLYDLYAARLFDYCHVLLRDERAASRALLDSLRTIRDHTGDPHSFRGRLYALTRDHCLRLRARSDGRAGRRRATEASDTAADEATRRLVHAALLVLSGRQREVLDLALRHRLSPDDLAPVLRTSPDEAASAVVRARRDFEDAFVAGLVATTGRGDCPSVSSLAGPPGRTLDARTCAALARHVDGCPICGTRGDLALSTEQLLDAMPVAALPADLREQFLAASAEPWFADARSPVTASVPQAERTPPPERTRTGSRLWPVAAGVAFATLMAGGTFYALSDMGSTNAGNDQALPSRPGEPPSEVPSSAPDSGAPLSGRGSTSPSPSPSTSSGTPTPTPTPGKSTPGTTPSAEVPQPPSHDPAPPPPPAPGTLVVAGCSMHGGRSCTITVTASGGPVNWSVTGTSGGVSAGGGGYLAAGQSTGVTATRPGGWCWGHDSGSVSFSSGASASVDWYC
jgi:DNA-directed RNA polymerase specialized sigma24 family protein